MLEAATDSEKATALFPDPARWSTVLSPLLEQTPNPALAVMRPFAGAVFAAHKSSAGRGTRQSWDINGYSVPLRMGIYAAHLVDVDNFTLLTCDKQAEILYLVSLTAELSKEQVDLLEDNKLFESHSDEENLVQVVGLEWMSNKYLGRIARNSGAAWLKEANDAKADPQARSRLFWERSEDKKHSDAAGDKSAVVRSLISKFLAASCTSTPTAWHAAKALSNLLRILVDAHGWQNIEGEEWLSKIGVLNTFSSNVLGATAVLIGLRDVLGTSKTVNNFCNRLVSDVGWASAQSEDTLGRLILLNACFAVYDGAPPHTSKSSCICGQANLDLDWYFS